MPWYHFHKGKGLLVYVVILLTIVSVRVMETSRDSLITSSRNDNPLCTSLALHPNRSAIIQNQAFISTEVPPFILTFSAMEGVVDPSITSRQVHLPPERDNWCSVSPCLTVTNVTQRVDEVPNFEKWVASRQKRWTDTFAPLVFEQKGPMYWYAPSESKSSTFYVRNRTHGFEYKDTLAPLPPQTGSSCEHRLNVSGTVLLWYNFHYGHYGHWIPDHVPPLMALLEILGDSVTWVALPYSQLSEEWLYWFDPTVRERVVFYPPGSVTCTGASTLIPLNKNGKGPQSWRSPATMSLLNQQVHDRHYRAASGPQKIVFASRNSRTAKHGRALVNERQVLVSIRRMMRLYNRSEELVVYTRDGASYDEQFRLFSTASIIMGPHGAAMSNVLWSRSGRGCQDPVHVVEFVGSMISGPRIQAEYHAFYDLEATVPWVTYHMVTFQDNSTAAHTSVSTSDVEDVLSWIWGGPDTAGSTTCFAALRH